MQPYTLREVNEHTPFLNARMHAHEVYGRIGEHCTQYIWNIFGKERGICCMEGAHAVTGP